MANPNKITIDISKSGTESCSLSVEIKENTLESLIHSLQEAKEVSNKYLTELVDEQKLENNSNSRKIDELADSDEDIEESTSKKLKEDNTIISNVDNSV